MYVDLMSHFESKNLIQYNEPIVIALSGGVDSMVLFSILNSQHENIIIAHVNHNKREASFVEYEELKEIALHKHVHFEGITLDELDGNFQKESRNKRYKFFVEVAKKYNAKKVFLAHHADDQLETILMRITRGSSFTGYAGIKETREFEGILFIRPLMDIDKSQIIEYAKHENISYFEDVSNAKDDYTRNRFRHNVVPVLRAENESLTQKTLQYSDYLSLADEFIIQQRDKFLEVHYENKFVGLDAFNHKHKILKIKVLKFLINVESNNTVEVSYQQYQDMIELLINESPNVSYDLKSGFSLIKVYNQFYIGKDIEISHVNLEINALGEYIIPHKGKYIFSDKKMDIKHTNYFELCYNDTVFPLYLRNRKDGDRMSLAVGTKKVKDILIDQKIPKFDRDNLILLTDKDKVLWIPIIKKSHQPDRNGAAHQSRTGRLTHIRDRGND